MANDEREGIVILFLDTGREPQCKPDPRYPDGKHIPPPPGSKEVCIVELPYPAPRCGAFIVKCEDCDMTIAVTAAGRPDDPRTVGLACDLKAKEHYRGKRQTH